MTINTHNRTLVDHYLTKGLSGLNHKELNALINAARAEGPVQGDALNLDIPRCSLCSCAVCVSRPCNRPECPHRAQKDDGDKRGLNADNYGVSEAILADIMLAALHLVIVRALRSTSPPVAAKIEPPGDAITHAITNSPLAEPDYPGHALGVFGPDCKMCTIDISLERKGF